MNISLLKNKSPLSEISILNEDLLNGGEILIGRESDCHIALDSFQISRYHASLKIVENKLKINLLSEYGELKVNGVDTKSADLSDGDKIDIGSYALVFKDIPMPVEVAQNHLEEFRAHEEIDSDIAVNENEVPSEVKAQGGDEFSMENDEGGDDQFELEGQDQADDDNEKDNLVSDQELEVEQGLTLDDDILGGDSSSEDITELEDDFNNEEGQDFSQDFGEEENDQNMNEFSSDEEPDQENNFEDGFSDNGGFGDDGFGDDNGFEGDDGFEDNSSSEDKTQVFNTFAKYSLKIFGEYAPFDRYLVEDGETNIGRDPEKCQIVLGDTEVSKVHAVIRKTKVNCTLEDLDSSNGIIYNGERINKVELLNGDEFVIGETTFTVEVSSDIIEAEKDHLMPVEDNQEVEIEEIVDEEVDFDNVGDGEEFGVQEKPKSLIAQLKTDPKKRMIAIVVVGLLLFIFFDDSSTEVQPDDSDASTSVEKKPKKKNKKVDPAKLEIWKQNYELAYAKFNAGEYYEAKEYIDKVDPSYKDTVTLKNLIQEGLDEIKKAKDREQREKIRRENQIKINALLEKAKKAVKERKVQLAKSLFNQIYEIDPENIEVPPMKLEIEAYEEEMERKKQEEQLKQAERQRKVDQLAPGKALYLKEDWFKAIDRLEKFLTIKGMDEDLIADATKMLNESKKNLILIINPLLSKARSFKEGQDLKQAYETYGEVLKYDPANEEALNERDAIFETLTNRSKKIYREALVAESLSLFKKAKEKFQEVQQISPINSEYYNKATEKLKNYLE